MFRFISFDRVGISLLTHEIERQKQMQTEQKWLNLIAQIAHSSNMFMTYMTTSKESTFSKFLSMQNKFNLLIK